MARLVDSDITTLTVIVGGVADPDNPKVSELTAGKDITCAIAYGYTLGMTASATVEGKLGLCDQKAATRRGDAAFGADLTILRADDKEGNDSAYIAAAEIFADPDVTIDIVRRGGIAAAPEDAVKNTTPYTAGQRVELYRFTTDFPQYRTGQEKGQDATFQVQPLATEVFRHDVAVIAGP